MVCALCMVLLVVLCLFVFIRKLVSYGLSQFLSVCVYMSRPRSDLCSYYVLDESTDSVVRCADCVMLLKF